MQTASHTGKRKYVFASIQNQIHHLSVSGATRAVKFRHHTRRGDHGRALLLVFRLTPVAYTEIVAQKLNELTQVTIYHRVTIDLLTSLKSIPDMLFLD